MNHYEVLGVPMGADPAEIHRAYLKLARRHHPDLHLTDPPAVQDKARVQMLAVNAAWAVLGDPGRRSRYDAEVRQGTATGAPTGPAQAARPGPGRGWTPLADDTRWINDFKGWRDETDRLPEEDGGPARPIAMLPVALFGLALLVGCVSVVLQARVLFVVAFVTAAFSAMLYFLLPMLAMTRSKRGEGR